MFLLILRLKYEIQAWNLMYTSFEMMEQSFMFSTVEWNYSRVSGIGVGPNGTGNLVAVHFVYTLASWLFHALLV